MGMQEESRERTSRFYTDAGEGTLPRHPIPKNKPCSTQRINGHRSEEGCLKRYIFICDRAGAGSRVLGFGRALVEVVTATGGRACATRVAAEVSTAAGFAAAAKQDEVIDDDFGHVFLLAAGFVVPRVRAQTTLDIDFVAFLQILAGNLGGARPSGNVVPLGAILPVAVLVFEALVGGQAELGHGRALRRVLHFGIFAEVTDEDNLLTLFPAMGCSFAGVQYTG